MVALLELRDDAHTQFASPGPTHALTLRAEPLLSALGITVTPELRAALGLPADTALEIPLQSAKQVEELRTRYTWAVLINRWGLVVGAVAGLVGLILARRPLRTFSIALVIGGALCFVAIPLFSLLHDWMIGGGVGAWGPLLTPLVTAAMAEIRPWLVPIGIASVVTGAALFGWVLYRSRTARVASAGAADPGEDAVHEGARVIG